MQYESNYFLFYWLLSLLPIALLLFTLLKLKWKSQQAALLSLVVALLASLLVFGISGQGLLVATGKGLSLSLFVLLIIWSAVILYHFAREAGALEEISSSMAHLSRGRLLQLLLMSWCFSSFIQGISGFGVPVAIVAPLMVGMGFDPLVAAATTLVGHSWAVTFGSMASSFYTLQLVTALPEDLLAFWLGILFLLPILFCGLAVAHIYGGWRAVREALPTVVMVSAVMGLTQLLVPQLGAVQLGSVLAGLFGTLTILIISRFRAGEEGDAFSSSSAEGSMTLREAFLPYLSLILLIIVFQPAPIREALAGFRIGFSFPEAVTAWGYRVPAVTDYAAIRLFAHPAPFILFSTLLAALFYRRRGYFKAGALQRIRSKTVGQCLPTTISISLLVVMALVMKDSGMTVLLAQGVANLSGQLYPIFSPLVGVLGSFMTGSNTNSNVLFGAFQREVALNLGLQAWIIAAAQSVGGSLGSAVAPAKALLGASTVGITGREGELLQKTLSYTLINVLLVGILTLLFTLW